MYYIVIHFAGLPLLASSTCILNNLIIWITLLALLFRPVAFSRLFYEPRLKEWMYPQDARVLVACLAMMGGLISFMW
jgi:hypothetical protein